VRVLVACEYSGVVRDAFRARGHSAWSCDLLPSEDDDFHMQKDVREVLDFGWDLMIAHPPCTHLAISGARWFKDKVEEQKQALAFVRILMNAPIPRICLENPISIISSLIRKPDQIVQPYYFGDPFRKSTCLWLKNLPLLVPTNVVDQGEIHITKSGKRIPAWYNLPPSVDRWKLRSTTFKGLANAMASQWNF
jgi:hypothetical protein